MKLLHGEHPSVFYLNTVLKRGLKNAEPTPEHYQVALTCPLDGPVAPRKC